MLLRLLTSFFLTFGIILTLGFPWLVRAKPHGGKVALEHYSLLFGTYLTVAMICFVAAAICAVLMVRQVREAYREQTRQNLEDLVESALRQHQKPVTKDES